MNRNVEQHSYAVYTRDSKMQEKSLVGGGMVVFVLLDVKRITKSSAICLYNDLESPVFTKSHLLH